MLSVYKSFHQTVKYGHQRNHILQYLTGLETLISMKGSKTENRFSTTESQLAKKTVLTESPESGKHTGSLRKLSSSQ